MKLISSFMSFFAKRKIYIDGNDSTMIVNLQHNVRVKPAPASFIATDCDNTCFISRDNDTPSYVREMINPPAIIQLNPERSMPKVARSSDRNMNYLDIRFFSGVFGFLIFKDNQGDQFLAIKRLDNYESNHSVLSLFARRGRFGEKLKTAKAICGGEVVLNQGCIERWNLKSGGYSQNNEFNEYKNPNIQESIASLWFPMQDKFRSIKDSDEHLKEKHTPKGSFRLVSTLFTVYSDKTVDNAFDHNYELTNQASQSTLPYMAYG